MTKLQLTECKIDFIVYTRWWFHRENRTKI